MGKKMVAFNKTMGFRIDLASKKNLNTRTLTEFEWVCRFSFYFALILLLQYFALMMRKWHGSIVLCEWNIKPFSDIIFCELSLKMYTYVFAQRIVVRFFLFFFQFYFSFLIVDIEHLRQLFVRFDAIDRVKAIVH